MLLNQSMQIRAKALADTINGVYFLYSNETEPVLIGSLPVLSPTLTVADFNAAPYTGGLRGFVRSQSMAAPVVSNNTVTFHAAAVGSSSNATSPATVGSLFYGIVLCVLDAADPAADLVHDVLLFDGTFPFSTITSVPGRTAGVSWTVVST